MSSSDSNKGGGGILVFSPHKEYSSIVRAVFRPRGLFFLQKCLLHREKELGCGKVKLG